MFNSLSIGPRRRAAQSGSALLVVLVFAAIVAIMLYRELPVAAFEAQRQREELLIARGNEYKRGVKLFVRKIGRFPNSIDELESTNRLRFLRHRYVDPLTGKEDWRLIHAGPGGIITDSKTQTTSPGGANPSTLGQGAVFAGFNNSFSGEDKDAEAPEDKTISAALRPRPPAIRNSGPSADSPAVVSEAGASAIDGTSTAGEQGAIDLGQVVKEGAVATEGGAVTGQPGDLSSKGSNSNTGKTSPDPSAGAPAAGLLAGAGGIAGVASIAGGAGIKVVNEQTKYNRWEFYYDLRKDRAAALAAAMGGLQTPTPGVSTNGAPGFGQTTTPGPSQTSFSGFGQQPSASPTPASQPASPE